MIPWKARHQTSLATGTMLYLSKEPTTRAADAVHPFEPFQINLLGKVDQLNQPKMVSL